MNKKFILVAKIFAIIGAVSSGLQILLSFLTSGSTVYYHNYLTITFSFIVYAAMLILSVIAAIRLDLAKDDKISKDEVLGWSIYLLFGGLVIGGIFGILGFMNIGSDLTSSSTKTGSLEEKLIELDRLYTSGILTREEYLEKRKRVILED